MFRGFGGVSDEMHFGHVPGKNTKSMQNWGKKWEMLAESNVSPAGKKKKETGTPLIVVVVSPEGI